MQRDLPIAISDDDPRKQRIMDCNPAAARHGIRAGLPVSAALGLAENLHLAVRDPAAERGALERLAGWCYQYSSQVSIIAERTALLLEAGASQRLFGAPAELTLRLSGELLQLGYHSRAGTAPTVEAAHLAAGQGLHFDHLSPIGEQARRLPLDSLHFEPAHRQALEKMGFRTVGEVLRLPRRALARRLGTGSVDYLDRLSGARPDPQRPWYPPGRFSSGIDLPAEVSHSQGLAFPLRRLLDELCGTLRAQDQGVQEIHIRLLLDRGEEHLRLGLQQPCREEARFMLLLRERLECLHLARPVRHIRLEAAKFLPFDACQDSLFRGDEDSATPPVAALLERLQARLGEHAVVGIRGVQDHRPEYSWSERKPDEPANCVSMPHRPVWLFSQAKRCRIADYQVLAGPERIETGWWDGSDCRRDYFVVRDAAGCTLWAYREYKPDPGWYLQGMFG